MSIELIALILGVGGALLWFFFSKDKNQGS